MSLHFPSAARVLWRRLWAALALLLLVAPPVWGQAAKRVALVVGNADYADAPLKNPVNDADDLAAKLRALGFEVTKLTNRSRSQLTAAIRDFGRGAAGADAALFYFAGHGVQVGGRNYLLPVGQRFADEAEVETDAVDVNNVLARMEEAGAKVSLLFLDACRTVPLKRSGRATTRGLARMDAPSGALVAFAAQPGAEAQDGVGRNGLFTKHLLAHIGTPNLPVEQLLKRVRAEVERETGRRQSPRDESSLTSDFYFAGHPGTSDDADQQAWDVARSTHTLAAYRAYAQAFPAGRSVAAAKVAIAGLEHADAATPVVALAPFEGDPGVVGPIQRGIARNFENSRLLRLADGGPQRLSEKQTPNFSEWAARGVTHVVTGSVSTLADERIDIRYRIWKVADQTSLDASSSISLRPDVKVSSNRVSDRIHTSITGVTGNFNRRIVKALALRDRYVLIISESDGSNTQTALSSKESIGLPTWSPDRTHIAYLSYESGSAQFFVQELASGARTLAASSAEIRAACAQEAGRLQDDQSSFRDDWLTEDWGRHSGAACRAAMLGAFLQR